jgi:formate-dependent phosphoribosylglycinamide formyltransferase (GAR transformylase)
VKGGDSELSAFLVVPDNRAVNVSRQKLRKILAGRVRLRTKREEYL